MIKKSAEIEIKSNASGSISELKELKKELKGVSAGSKEFDVLSAKIRELDDAISDARATNDDFLGQLENASGPLGMIGQGIRGAERTFSSFNGALKASVIGLLVGLVAGLAAAFSSNDTAIKKIQPLLDGMQKIFQGIFRAVEPLFNTLVDLAISALPAVSKAFEVVYSSVVAVFKSLGMLGSAIKKLISGDFSGAWSDAKKSVTGFSESYDVSVASFQRGTREMTKTEKEESDKRAEARKAAAEKAAQEQGKNNEAYKTAYEKQLDDIENLQDDNEEKKLARAKERDLEAINSLKGKTDSEIQVLIDGNNKKYDLIEENEKKLLDMQSAKSAISILDNLNQSLETPAQKEEREYQDKKVVLEANNLSTELLTQTHLSKLDTIKKAADAKETADKKTIRDKEINDEKILSDTKLKIKNDEVAVLGELGNLLGQLAGKNKQMQKAALIAQSAASIASIIINTNVGSSKEVATKGIFGLSTSAILYAKMGLSIGSVIAATARGLSGLGGGSIGGGSIGGGSVDGNRGGGLGGVTLPTAPNVQFQNTPQSQISDTIQSSSQARNNEPIKAYVVTNDITTAQELTRNTIESSKF